MNKGEVTLNQRGIMRIIIALTLSLLSVAPLYGQNIWQYIGLQGIARPIVVGSNGTIFVASSGSVYRSTDNGDSWIKASNGLPDTLFISSLAINSRGHIFAGTGQGIYRSTDGGESWTQSSNGLPANPNVWSLAINVNGFIFAGAEQGVYRSKNNGESWTPINRGLANPPVGTSTISPAKFRNTTFLTFAISPNGDIFAGANDGLYRSTNNGKKWRQVGFVDQEISTLAVNTNGQVFATISFLGVFSSTDNGDTWTRVNDGQTTGAITALAISPNGHLFAGTQERGVFRSTDNGVGWSPANSGFTIMKPVYALAFSPSGDIFAGTTEGFFRRVLSTISE